MIRGHHIYKDILCPSHHWKATSELKRTQQCFCWAVIENRAIRKEAQISCVVNGPCQYGKLQEYLISWFNKYPPNPRN